MSRRHRVLVELLYPTDTAVIERLVKGENLRMKDRGPLHRAQVGDIVDDIPAVSIEGLLRKGRIEEVPDDEKEEEAEVGP